MGQVVEAVLLYLAGTNQYQDPGLEPEIREEACRAVAKALVPYAKRRDVFTIDEDLRMYERLYAETKRATTKLKYETQMGYLWEEMLSHGGC